MRPNFRSLPQSLAWIKSCTIEASAVIPTPRPTDPVEKSTSSMSLVRLDDHGADSARTANNEKCVLSARDTLIDPEPIK